MAWHARISASSMKRVLKCPGSVALIEAMPKHLRRPSGEAARLGTAAHGLGEFCLTHGKADSQELLGGLVCLDAQEDAMVVHPLDLNREEPAPEVEAIMRSAKWTYTIDDDMCSAVDVYLRVVAEEAAKLQDPELAVERRFDLDWLRPDLGGTSDCNIYEFLGTLVVIDYKHGQGVAVDVNDNEQMLTYALGSAKEVDWLFEKLVLIIVQPRCPHLEGGVRRFETTKERLLAFQDEVAAGYDKVMQAGSDLAEAEAEFGKGCIPEWWANEYLKAGDHCTFCDRNGPLCPKMVERISEVAKADFADVMEDEDCLADQLPKDPEELLNAEVAQRIADVLEWVPAIDRFIKAAKSLGFQHAAAGHKVPGHKLVEGRSVRKLVVPEKTVVERVTELGIAKERLYEPPKLKSPAQLEKLGAKVKRLVNGVAAEDGTWAVEPLAMKGRGSLSLVPDSNPKPAVTLDPGADFADVEEDEGDG